MREFLRAALVGGAFIAAAAFLSGATVEPFADGGNAVLVEEVYTVRPGDTMLVERRGEIYPGDKLTLTYWVKSEEETK